MENEAPLVPVEDLTLHPFNRQVYGTPGEGLVGSIREFGLQNPILINPNGEILSGARRWKAFQSLERSKIPAQKVDLEDEEGEKRLILVENAYRGRKPPKMRLREANAYYELFKEGEATKEDLRKAAEQQDTEPQNDRPFCLAAAAAGLNKSDYNGLQRLFGEDRLWEDIQSASAEGEISDEQEDDLHTLLRRRRRAVSRGDRSPSTAATEIAETLHEAIKAEEKRDRDDRRDEEKTDREEANEAIQLAQRRGKQFLEALRDVNAEYAEYVALEDGPTFRRILGSIAKQVDKLAESAGWEPQEEAA